MWRSPSDASGPSLFEYASALSAFNTITSDAIGRVVTTRVLLLTI